MEVKIPVPKEVNAKLEGNTLVISGKSGENKRIIDNPFIKLSIEGENIVIKSANEKSLARKYKRVVNSFEAHVVNMIEGAQKGYEARLKITYSHFPVTVKNEGNKVIIENFIGEKVPRVTKTVPGTKMIIKGNEITITGSDREAVGQAAANLENRTQIKYRDRRVFQDGIWIVKKP